MVKTLPQLAQALNTIHPTRYSHFASKQEPPFITYLDDGDDNFHADNIAYKEGNITSVELYTKNKDLTSEKSIKELFNNNKIPYDKGPTIFIQSEGLFLTTFTIKLI